MYSIYLHSQNEAILKALFKVKDDDLPFQRVVEEAAKVAKETTRT